MGGGGTSFERSCSELDVTRQDEIVEALERAGYTCRRDDELIRAATGWRGPSDL
jgi:hypothetical protein